MKTPADRRSLFLYDVKESFWVVFLYFPIGQYIKHSKFEPFKG